MKECQKEVCIFLNLNNLFIRARGAFFTYFHHFLNRMCTPKTMPPSTDITPGKEIDAFKEEPIAPNLKIELCFMPGMTARSRPPINPSMNIVIVNCKEEETCTPSNTAIVGNEFGYVYLLLYTLFCNSLIHF